MSRLGSISLDPAAIARLLTAEDGPVGRAIFDAATRVQLAARAQVGKDTRDLERSIVKRPFTVPGGGVGVSVGSTLPYALIHHEGRREVVPVRARVLRFTVRGQVVYARRSRAVPANKFLTDNLDKAIP